MKMRKTIIIGIILIIILAFMIVILPSLSMAQNDANDTWDDTHWGGDVGEEEYSVSEDDGTRDDGDICNTGICSSVILFGVVIVPPYIKYWKRNNE